MLSMQEIRQVGIAAADEMMERVAERERDSMMLHSVPYAYGSPGIVTDEALARATPCRYIEYRPGKRLAFSRGIVGALSDEQEKVYCPEWIRMESPGLQRRLESWMQAVEAAKKEVAAIPKGERLGPWLAAMSRELKARGIEARRGITGQQLPFGRLLRAEEIKISRGGSYHSNPGGNIKELAGHLQDLIGSLMSIEAMAEEVGAPQHLRESLHRIRAELVSLTQQVEPPPW